MVDDASLVLSVGAQVDSSSDGEREDRIRSIAFEKIFSIGVVGFDEFSDEFDQRSFQLLIQRKAGIYSK